MIRVTPEGNAVFGEHDQGTLDQLDRCTRAVEGARGALMADGHLGYSAPIGSVIAYPEHVSPSGVGYDIGCGNLAVRTNVLVSDFAEGDLDRIMDSIIERVSFGIGRNSQEKVDHPVLERIAESPVAEQVKMVQLAANQLGTVGAGNHYVDLFEDADRVVWIGVHFGSRGFGHKTASGFLNLAAGREWDEKHQGESMHAEPTLLPVASDLGQAYIAGMELAGAYAYAGRETVVQTVCDILGADVELTVHNHHNYAWHERHYGQDYWVVRKGATPAQPGQRGFVGATMGEQSVILEGRHVYDDEAEATMFSTVHGAGRAMSRTEAAGKVRKRKRYGCPERDCTYSLGPQEFDNANQHRGRACPTHERPLRKFWQTERKSEGRINWPAAKAALVAEGIHLRGGAADEAPGAYKRLSEVLAAHDNVNVLYTLRPLGVAMAGADTFDPFKD